MKIDKLKRALVEVKAVCKKIDKCINCPFRKMTDVGNPYCPLFENKNDNRFFYPEEWDINDWKEN